MCFVQRRGQPVNNIRGLSISIGVIFAMLGALVACTTPATPEETCLSAAKNIVKGGGPLTSLVFQSKSDAAWPIAITDVSVINSEPILCKGVATLIDDGTDLIQFFETSDQIGFEALSVDQRKCDKYLTNSIMEFSKEISLKTGGPEIIKIYYPEEISNTGTRLTCKGEARFDTGENDLIEFFYELDEDLEAFIGLESE